MNRTFLLSMWLPLAAMLFFSCASNPEKFYNEGLVYLKLNQAEEAEKSFQVAVVKDPKNAAAWNQLGILEFDRGDMERAKKYFHEAFQLDSLNTAYIRNLSYAYVELGKPDVAEALLDRALALDPTDSNTQNAMGKLQFLQKNYSAARQSFKRAIDTDPANYEAKDYLSRLDAVVQNGM